MTAMARAHDWMMKRLPVPTATADQLDEILLKEVALVVKARNMMALSREVREDEIHPYLRGKIIRIPVLTRNEPPTMTTTYVQYLPLH